MKTRSRNEGKNEMRMRGREGEGEGNNWRWAGRGNVSDHVRIQGQRIERGDTDSNAVRRPDTPTLGACTSVETLKDLLCVLSATSSFHRSLEFPSWDPH